MRRVLLAGVAMCLLLATLLGGTAPVGRVALALGLPGIAAPFFSDPYWRGAAAYRSGAFDAAAEAFTAAGPAALFNLGNAQAMRSEYAAALEAFDLALLRGPDPQAQANFDLVRTFYGATALDPAAVIFRTEREGATEESFVARGAARGAGTGDEVTNTATAPDLLELESHGNLGVRRIFDDLRIVASPRWLATLEDVPGAFLGARIAAEHERRRKAGTGQVPEETEW
ncbi:tetratricopeptide repeat protein [Sulfitobacter sp. D35]|uniref:tetratricopeptide repeat protein n=1 Tax=Sulfitobacter sp. D35 TaxID=3083252 RepID=UPI00296FDD4D|nr:tetratricopeptide repeat protein [Sulfitobacter sp. D35]MDW4498644.1 tetratricopeptide repeat protein [Sulfitobacter sp. D35]